MFKTISLIANLFFMWLIIGLLGDWALWWEFSDYAGISSDFLTQAIEGFRELLIEIGKEFRKTLD